MRRRNTPDEPNVLDAARALIAEVRRWIDAEQRFDSKPVKQRKIIGYCYLCGRAIFKGDRTEIDHIIPKSRRGANHPENYSMVHRLCNRYKGNRLPSEYWQTQRFRERFGTVPPWANNFP